MAKISRPLLRLLAVFALVPRPAQAVEKAKEDPETFWDRLKEYVEAYRPGLSYAAVNGNVTLNYETDGVGDMPGCKPHDETTSRCEATMAFDHGSGFALFLDQPIKSDGLFYLDFGPSFELEQFNTGYDDDSPADPLNKARFQMVGFNTNFLVSAGLTPPRYWPDFIASLGLGLGPLVGKAEINGVTTSKTLVNLYVTVELDLVVWRRKQGQVTLFALSESGGNFYFNKTYGAVRNPYYTFERYDSGLSYLIKRF